MYRTLIIALASTAALCGGADAQVAGSVTGNVNATLEHSRLPVDPRTGRPLSRIEMMRAQRAARLARRQAEQVAAEDALADSDGPPIAAALNRDGLDTPQTVEAPTAPVAGGVEFAGSPAPTTIEARELAPVPPVPVVQVAAPQSVITAAAPSAAIATASPRPVYEPRTVINRERAAPVAAQRTAPREPISTEALPAPQAAPQPPTPRTDASTSSASESAGIADWITVLLASLAVAGAILAARRVSRRDAAA